MAFLAKQFMSLLLLLITSRLILSTHAAGRHFSQYGRMTTTTTTTDTTDSTEQKPDNYGKFSQPTFYQNNGERNGLGNSPSSTRTTPTSFLPSNYDPEMYTTSRETQKNMYAAKQNEDQTVAEKYGAYNNPFSSSKSVDQYYYKDNKKPTTTESEELNQYYYKDNSYQHDQQQVEPTKATKYDPYSSKYNQRYNQNNQFYQQNNQFQQQVEPSKATKYDPSGSSTKSSQQQYIEAAEEAAEEKKKKPTTVPESYKYNPFQAYDPTESKKQSNSKFNEQYANEDAELDAFLNDPQSKHGASNIPSYKSSKNSYWTTKKDTNNEWAGYDQKQGKDDKHFAMTDAELNAILDEEDKQGEDEIESESLPQGMSDTRLDTNKLYYQPYKWQEHAKEFANPFSGDALSYAAKTNP